jgi:hypothetical protein
MAATVFEITSREFRNRQKDMFDLADKGEKVIIRRGKKRSYILIPIDDDDMVLSPAMVEKIERGLKNIRDGKTKRYTMDDLCLKMGL